MNDGGVGFCSLEALSLIYEKKKQQIEEMNEQGGKDRREGGREGGGE